MNMKIHFFPVVIYVLFLVVPSSRSEEMNTSLWLGFPILGRDQQPAEINLTKDKSLGSAFLLQLRRQALLIAARDELGIPTFDEFMGETAPNGAVKIDNIDLFPNTNVPYSNHSQFLAELEKCSRNEFVAELKKRGMENRIKKSKETETKNILSDEKTVNEKHTNEKNTIEK
jgi:hypothetical protein